MRDSRRRLARRAAASLAAALALGACAPSPPPAPPLAPEPPVPPLEMLGAADLSTLGTLLRLADTRDFDGPALESAATNGSRAVRRQTALALGWLRRPEGAPILGRLLADQDTAVAATAAFSLGQVADSASVGLLAAILADSAARADRPTVAAEAATALGKIRVDAAHRALTDFLEGEAARTPPAPGPIVAAALLAVWKFPAGDDVAAILPWLASDDVEVRRAAAYALTRRPTPSAAPRLLESLDDPDPQVRAFALRGLTGPQAQAAGLDASAVGPAVLEAAGDSSYQVRVEAVRALGSFPLPPAITALRGLLTDPSRHVALTAAEALGRGGPPAAVAAQDLERLVLVEDAPVALRAAALDALAGLAPDALPVIDLAAESPEWRLRAAAARAYALLDDAGAEGIRTLVADPDPRVAGAALLAMVEAGPGPLAPSRDLLVSSLGHADVMVRATALQGLWNLADPATLPLLLDAFGRAQSDTVDDAALAALDAMVALRAQGASPERALFARFPRPESPHVVQRAIDRFGEDAARAWGPAFPLPARPEAEYRDLARRWLSPGAAERRPRVIVETDQGTIELELFAEAAPLTVESFLDLARAGYFDGQEWPRVVPDFVVQGGDPRGDSSGGPGYSIRDEINRHRYLTGTLGMALSGPDTGGSQFFITHSPQPHLDGTYAVFGEVLEGQDVVERILPGDLLLRVTEAP